MSQQPNLLVGSVYLKDSCPVRDAGKSAEEVMLHLSTLLDAEVVVRLEIQVRVPGRVHEDTVRTVSENARTLKFDSASFESE